jgi:hypothetical protein
MIASFAPFTAECTRGKLGFDQSNASTHAENLMPDISRRDCLWLATGAALTGAVGSCATGEDAAEPAPRTKPKSVAAVVTVYYHNSHADVILGKILEGWKQDGGPGPALKLPSLYIDQIPDSDIGRAACKKHGVPIFESIEKAVTVGGDRIPIDAVLSIGEHGDYPYNEIGQHLYPRRRFFEEITATFQKFGRVVPVFNDKHLGPTWSDAKWMYDRAQQLKVPFMGGSSLPVGYRTSEIAVPMGCEIEAAVGIGYSDLEAYGIHALEFYQYHVERRDGAERGVKSVQFLDGPAMWKAVDDGLVSEGALNAAFAAVPKSGQPNMRHDKSAGLFLFQYLDGLTGAVFMLGCVAGTAIGLKLKGQPQPIATAFDERTEPRYPHFAYLLKAIERMVHSGRPTYPVERTLLTSGILDRLMVSRSQKGKRLDTPELAISYKPVDYSWAPHVDLFAAPGT